MGSAAVEPVPVIGALSTVPRLQTGKLPVGDDAQALSLGVHLMADDPRRFDDLVRTVGELRRQLEQLQATVLPAGALVLRGAPATAGTSLNTLIASLPATGGTITVPAGSWTLDTAVLPSKSGIVLRGVSAGASRLRFDGSAVPVAIRNPDTTQRYVTIQDLGIECTTDGVGTAIDASHLVNSQFERLRIGNAGVSPNKGILFNANGTYYNTVRDSRIQVAGSDSRCVTFDNIANSNWMDNVRLLGDANTTGVYVNSHANTLAHVDCETTMGVAIDVDAHGHDTTILSPYIEAVTIGLRLASGVEAPTVVGGFIADCTGKGVLDNGAQALTLLNVRLQYVPATAICPDRIVLPGGGVLSGGRGGLSFTGGSGTVTEIAPR